MYYQETILLILPSLKEGGFGGIAGCSNVYPHVVSSIYDLFKEGKMEEAEAAQESIASFRAVFKYGNPNTVVKKPLRCLDIRSETAADHSTICVTKV